MPANVAVRPLTDREAPVHLEMTAGSTHPVLHRLRESHGNEPRTVDLDTPVGRAQTDRMAELICRRHFSRRRIRELDLERGTSPPAIQTDPDADKADRQLRREQPRGGAEPETPEDLERRMRHRGRCRAIADDLFWSRALSLATRGCLASANTAEGLSRLTTQLREWAHKVAWVHSSGGDEHAEAIFWTTSGWRADRLPAYDDDVGIRCLPWSARANAAPYRTGEEAAQDKDDAAVDAETPGSDQDAPCADAEPDTDDCEEDSFCLGADAGAFSEDEDLCCGEVSDPESGDEGRFADDIFNDQAPGAAQAKRRASGSGSGDRRLSIPDDEVGGVPDGGVLLSECFCDRQDVGERQLNLLKYSLQFSKAPRSWRHDVSPHMNKTAELGQNAGKGAAWAAKPTIYFPDSAPGAGLAHTQAVLFHRDKRRPGRHDLRFGGPGGGKSRSTKMKLDQLHSQEPDPSAATEEQDPERAAIYSFMARSSAPYGGSTAHKRHYIDPRTDRRDYQDPQNIGKKTTTAGTEDLAKDPSLTRATHAVQEEAGTDTLDNQSFYVQRQKQAMLAAGKGKRLRVTEAERRGDPFHGVWQTKVIDPFQLGVVIPGAAVRLGYPAVVGQISEAERADAVAELLKPGAAEAAALAEKAKARGAKVRSQWDQLRGFVRDQLELRRADYKPAPSAKSTGREGRFKAALDLLSDFSKHADWSRFTVNFRQSCLADGHRPGQKCLKQRWEAIRTAAGDRAPADEDVVKLFSELGSAAGGCRGCLLFAALEALRYGYVHPIIAETCWAPVTNERKLAPPPVGSRRPGESDKEAFRREAHKVVYTKGISATGNATVASLMLDAYKDPSLPKVVVPPQAVFSSIEFVRAAGGPAGTEEEKKRAQHEFKRALSAAMTELGYGVLVLAEGAPMVLTKNYAGGDRHVAAQGTMGRVRALVYAGMSNYRQMSPEEKARRGSRSGVEAVLASPLFPGDPDRPAYYHGQDPPAAIALENDGLSDGYDGDREHPELGLLIPLEEVPRDKWDPKTGRGDWHKPLFAAPGSKTTPFPAWLESFCARHGVNFKKLRFRQFPLLARYAWNIHQTQGLEFARMILYLVVRSGQEFARNMTLTALSRVLGLDGLQLLLRDSRTGKPVPGKHVVYALTQRLAEACHGRRHVKEVIEALVFDALLDMRTDKLWEDETQYADAADVARWEEDRRELCMREFQADMRYLATKQLLHVAQGSAVPATSGPAPAGWDTRKRKRE